MGRCSKRFIYPAIILLSFVVTGDSQTIDGYVRSEDGRPVDLANIVLISDQIRKGTAHSANSAEQGLVQ